MIQILFSDFVELKKYVNATVCKKKTENVCVDTEILAQPLLI